MIEAVKVRLREGGKIQDYDTGGLEVRIGSRVIVPTPDGLTLGTVVSNPQRLDEEYVKTSFRRIVRGASPEDEERVRRQQELERAGYAACQRLIAQLRLPMKLVEVEQLFEGGKAVFYFTAEGRVDFRQLVRELARECRTRIEMRQIGVRDEARMIGGYGICGRELCCASFLSEFEPISIRMAKDQDLPLSPGKVSGVCGRLMCCLGYESRVYEEFKQGLPRIGERVRLAEGVGRVRKYNLFDESFTVELEGGSLLRIGKEEWQRGRAAGVAGGPPRQEGRDGRGRADHVRGGDRRRDGGRGGAEQRGAPGPAPPQGEARPGGGAPPSSGERRHGDRRRGERGRGRRGGGRREPPPRGGSGPEGTGAAP